MRIPVRVGFDHEMSRTVCSLFLIFGTDLENQNIRCVTRPDFEIKAWFIHKVQKCPFLRCFWHFAGKLADDLVVFVDENGRTNQCRTSCENRMCRKNLVLEIIIHKVQIWVKSGFQRMSYISRTVNASENLI